MPRVRIRHDDEDRQRAWVVETLAAPLHTATRMPLIQRPKPNPVDPGPTLLDLLASMEPPAPVDYDDVPGAIPSIRRLLMGSGVLQPLTPLALKRRRLAAERQATARIRKGNGR